MVVSITVFDEAPTKVTLSTLLKSSVPWGVAMGIVSTIWGGFLNWGKPEGFRLFDTGALGTWVLAKWVALWRKFLLLYIITPNFYIYPPGATTIPMVRVIYLIVFQGYDHR